MSVIFHPFKWVPVLALSLLLFVTAHAAEDTEDSTFQDFSKMTPNGTLEFDVTSLKLMAGGSWGEGTLTYKGEKHKLKVAAISVGGVGYRTMKGTGEVYKLNQLSDIEGVYGGAAGATAGNVGGGVATIENGKGVVIRTKVTDSEGVQLSLSLGGVEIELADQGT